MRRRSISRSARRGLPLLLSFAVSAPFVGGCSGSRAEYEKAAKDLQPMFDALTALRGETLLDPNVPDGGDIGKTIHEQVDKCAALSEKAAKLTADPAPSKDKPLVSMVTTIQRDLADKSASEACAAATTDSDDPVGTLGRWKKCVDACRAWFVTVERDVTIFSSSARSAGIESKGMPRDPRFD